MDLTPLKASIFFLIFLTFPLFSTPLSKYPGTLSFHVKEYSLLQNDSLLLYGIQNRQPFGDATSFFYVGEFGYGALMGNRSGYLEGGVCGGIRYPLLTSFYCDMGLFLGAGGGGGAIQGSGLFMNPTVSLVWPFSAGWSIQADTGYLAFFNSPVQSITLGLGIRMDYWSLYEP